MPFKQFVEIGRVALLNAGPDAGKVAAIVDVIDQNRVLVDGPCSGVVRKAYRLRELQLTPLRLRFPHSARTRVVRKAWEAEKVGDKWEGSAWAKRMAMRQKRQRLNDFDRFRLSKAKRARNHLLTKEINSRKRKLAKEGKM